MKDIVENRKHIGWGHKCSLALLALRENGLAWCTYFAAYYAASTVANGAYRAMNRLRSQRNLPGLNSAGLNKRIWESWDWSAEGNEWNQSAEWKQSLIRSVLQLHIPIDSKILEIGPGGGRWTEHLLQRARDYIGIDISSTCVAHCKQRFANEPRAKFVVGSGRDLAGVTDGSVDAIWSFDVFVHINSAEVESYAREFARVMRPGGIAVIHHGGIGGIAGGWRSNLTAHAFHTMLSNQGLKIEQALDHWAADSEEPGRLSYGDLITIFSKPARGS